MKNSHNNNPNSDADDAQRLELAASLASLPPRDALLNPDIARIFKHYINILAPWYDLNDSRRVFGSDVPACALNAPVLFRVIIAFSSSHWSKITGNLGEIAFAFHASCVELLLETLDSVPDVQGEYLAAACLLQSYLNKVSVSHFIVMNSRQSNRSTREWRERARTSASPVGAYSLSSSVNLELQSWSLPQAGFWNYLREEISVGLACRRPVRIGNHLPWFRGMVASPDLGDDMRANLITYTLANIMNIYFSSNTTQGGSNSILNDEQLEQWEILQEDLTLWRTNLPSTFEPFSRASSPSDVFPSWWMLKAWHGKIGYSGDYFCLNKRLADNFLSSALQY